MGPLLKLFFDAFFCGFRAKCHLVAFAQDVVVVNARAVHRESVAGWGSDVLAAVGIGRLADDSHLRCKRDAEGGGFTAVLNLYIHGVCWFALVGRLSMTGKLGVYSFSDFTNG